MNNKINFGKMDLQLSNYERAQPYPHGLENQAIHLMADLGSEASLQKLKEKERTCVKHHSALENHIICTVVSAL